MVARIQGIELRGLRFLSALRRVVVPKRFRYRDCVRPIISMTV